MMTSPKFEAKYSDAANKLAQAVKSLSQEARMWAAELTERAGRATPEQRTAAAIKHLAALPQGPRADAYRKLAELESHAVRPLQLGLKL